MQRLAGLLVACVIATQVAHAQQEKLQVRIGYLTQQEDLLAPLSLLDVEIDDNGISGARLANKENSTTGQFTNQEFSLEAMIVPEDGDVAAEFTRLVQGGLSLFIVDLPADKLLQIADS
ncbi:MAG: branched-chain amino acid ABC transporter substrate-binding protein, partial [Gammaproteobacteria bacterium]|nr:branched-chain amino acid ABC transporter substrate-binding protein [Gammaproteobacteria bacterium]